MCSNKTLISQKVHSQYLHYTEALRICSRILVQISSSPYCSKNHKILGKLPSYSVFMTDSSISAKFYWVLIFKEFTDLAITMFCSPGEGNDNPLQYSWLENPMDRGAWQATVLGVTKTWTWLSDWTHTYRFYRQTLQAISNGKSGYSRNILKGQSVDHLRRWEALKYGGISFYDLVNFIS